MTEVTDSAAAAVAPNRGVKQGLPKDGLPTAAKNAIALWEVARLGTTPKMAYAEKLGRKSASGGGWDTLVAPLRGFGLLRTDGEQIGLSPLGQDLVNGSDPSKQMTARRTALLHLKAYKDLVGNFDGTSLPDKAALASKLKFEYGKSDDFAAKAAQAFIDSLAFAQMLDADGRVVREGAATNALDASTHDESSSVDEDDDEDQAQIIDDAFGDEALDEDEDNDSDTQHDLGQTFTSARGLGQINVSVTLDLSRFRAEEVIEILKVLKR